LNDEVCAVHGRCFGELDFRRGGSAGLLSTAGGSAFGAAGGSAAPVPDRHRRGLFDSQGFIPLGFDLVQFADQGLVLVEDLGLEDGIR
jgi:hypothetical protein